MWVEQTKNGKFKFVERYTNPLTGEEKKASITLDKNTKSSWKQAQTALSIKIESILRTATISLDHKKLTLRELIEAYHKAQKISVSQATYNRNFFACKSLMRILGENTLVEKITAGYIKTKFFETGEESGRLNERLTRLKALFRWGYENDLVSDIQFLDKIKRFPDISKREKIEDKFLESDELKLLIAGMDVDIWILLSKLLSLSGMRIGEALALNKNDVDFKNMVIHITKTYDYISDITTDPKTAASYRDIYMQKELEVVCREINAYMLRQSLMYGYDRNKLFMQNCNGEHLSYYAYNKYLKENAKRILNREHVTPHIMRHTHTCLLAESGVSLDTISRRLGHENTKITKDIYFHITKKIKEIDNRQIAGIAIF